MDSLYAIREVEKGENQSAEISVEINPTHSVFEGHFPGQPILPGVIMIDILNDCLQNLLNAKYRMKSASQIKYLNVVDPRKHAELRLSITWTEKEDGLLVQCNSKLDEATANFKIKGIFEQYSN